MARLLPAFKTMYVLLQSQNRASVSWFYRARKKPACHRPFAVNHNALFQPVAAFAAKLDALVVFRTAFFANVKRKARTAIGTELALPGGFAAVGTKGCFLFDLTLKHLCLLRLVPDVALHLIGTRRGNLYIHTRGALGTQPHLVVPTRIAHPHMALVAAVKMLFGFVLRSGEGFFMFFVPVGRHAGKTLSPVSERITELMTISRETTLSGVGKKPAFA